MVRPEPGIPAQRRHGENRARRAADSRGHEQPLPRELLDRTRERREALRRTRDRREDMQVLGGTGQEQAPPPEHAPERIPGRNPHQQPHPRHEYRGRGAELWRRARRKAPLPEDGIHQGLLARQDVQDQAFRRRDLAARGADRLPREHDQPAALLPGGAQGPEAEKPAPVPESAAQEQPQDPHL